MIRYNLHQTGRSGLVFYLLLLFSFGAAAETVEFRTNNPEITPLDSLVQAQISQNFDPGTLIGLTLGITRNDEVYYYHYGSVEKGKEQLPDLNTIYEIGSLTKTFTGTLLARAVLDKKVDLDDDIRTYLPGDYDNLQFNGTPITLKHLANHSSGLPEDIYPEALFEMKDPSMFDIIAYFDDDPEALYFKEGLHRVQPAVMPGTEVHYSNTGFTLLGMILEKVYRKPYDKLIKKYITRPLGMKHTEPVLYKTDTTSYTKGYDGSGQAAPHITFQIAGAGGGLTSTAADLMKYMRANLTKKNPAYELAQSTSFDNGKEALGLGWHIEQDTHDNVCFWKDGGEPGFSSYIFMIPEKQIGIVCLSNQRGHQYEFSIISRAIADQVINRNMLCK